MKLYYFKGSCALAPHIALEWAGADYETEAVKRNATRSPEFLETINPRGKVPVLELDDGRKLDQVNAILLWIAEAFEDADLGPGESADDRFAMQNLLSHFNGDVHPAFTPYFLTHRFTTEEGHQPSVKDAALKELAFQLDGLERHMEGRQWVLGDRRTILDAYMTVFCSWARFVPGAFDGRSNLKAYWDRMQEDEGAHAALNQQGLI